MGNFKGTQGKWLIPEHRDNIVTDEVGNHIATVWIAGVGNDNQLYNTKLIAAAPELLEALSVLVEWYADRGESFDKMIHEDIILPIEKQNGEIKKAMLAIKKATE